MNKVNSLRLQTRPAAYSSRSYFLQLYLLFFISPHKVLAPYMSEIRQRLSVVVVANSSQASRRNVLSTTQQIYSRKIEQPAFSISSRHRRGVVSRHLSFSSVHIIRRCFTSKLIFNKGRKDIDCFLTSESKTNTHSSLNVDTLSESQTA